MPVLRTTVCGDMKSFSSTPISQLTRSQSLHPALYLQAPSSPARAPSTVELRDLQYPMVHRGKYC